MNCEKMVIVFGKCVFWLLLLEFSALAVKGLLSSDDQIKREHSLVSPFQDMDMNLSFWDVMGHTDVTKDYIRLTPDLPSSSGAIWNNSTCLRRNWEVLVTFRIHGKGSELFGDGLAVWYTKERMQAGSVFGSTDFFSGLGVFLDTHSNTIGPNYHPQPYLTAFINNGSISYGHVRKETRTQLVGCEVQNSFRNVAFDTLISIRYENDVLSVSYDMGNSSEWKTCFKINGVELPTFYFFGISASTSDLSDNHDILGFKFYDLDINVSPEQIAARGNQPPKGNTFVAQPVHKDGPKRGNFKEKTFLMSLFGVTAVVVAALMIFTIYKEGKSVNRFLWITEK